MAEVYGRRAGLYLLCPGQFRRLNYIGNLFVLAFIIPYTNTELQNDIKQFSRESHDLLACGHKGSVFAWK